MNDIPGDRPQRPHPTVLARHQRLDRLQREWIDTHPGAADEAMWDDPEFVEQVDLIWGRSPSSADEG